MPKFYPYKIADHFLYFTAECIVEAMHVHASDRKMTEAYSAKFLVRSDGSSFMQKRGDLTDKEIRLITEFIKENYIDMYKMWKNFGGMDFYQKKD
ncbi:MAG: DUF4160 domain-containing protein [Flexilinea sp.]|nr:DUF4160 domain-containing protein [Flexilinea sp.]